MQYYLARSTPTQKWGVTTTKGSITHPDAFETAHAAAAARDILNDAIDAERKTKSAPVGRPALPDDQKAKRVFFTLRPKVWKAISPDGNAKELAAFAKDAIKAKLVADGLLE